MFSRKVVAPVAKKPLLSCSKRSKASYNVEFLKGKIPDRRTKIIATLGPASANEKTLTEMMNAGLNAVRLNFSHGTHPQHKEYINLIRTAQEKVDKPICILQDLQGPKIRVGKFENNAPVQLENGDHLTITTDAAFLGNKHKVGTTYLNLVKDIVVGNNILIDDGNIRLKAVSKKMVNPNKASIGDEVECEVVVGGKLSNNKGINLPDSAISAPALTEKDIADMEFGLKNGVDIVCLSFVRQAEDLMKARELLRKIGYPKVPIVSKIERMEAINNFPHILEYTDGIMVARGDLGVEVDYQLLPALQKQLIAQAGAHGKFDITATQMLASMVDNPVPTRSEICDVANAIYDGTDAVMLSNETATGAHPVKAIQVMDEIAKYADASFPHYGRFDVAISEFEHGTTGHKISALTALAATSIASKFKDAKLICVLTGSGKTAVQISQYKPQVPIIAATANDVTFNRLALTWGVSPMKVGVIANESAIDETLKRALIQNGHAKVGDVIIIVLGTKSFSGASNNVRVIPIYPQDM